MITPYEIIQLIKANASVPSWVITARETNAELNALVYGENFKELLINNIEKIEDTNRAIARKKYSYDTRDLFARIMEPRNNVFAADGGSENWRDEINEKRIEDIKTYFQNFKGGKSIEKYMAESYFQLSDIDPNGLIFLEYKANDEGLAVYPTYKSIQDIRTYECKGQSVKWVLFEPYEVTKKGDVYKVWRFVDKDVDYSIMQRRQSYEYMDEESFINDFRTVPAVILSPIQKIGTNIRLSWLFYIQELSKKYARDVSIKTLYEFLQGFPKHWRYVMMCMKCRGNGTQDDGGKCNKCSGTGELRKGDVTDEIRVPIPNDKDQPVVAPNIAGFISPDLDTLKHMEESRVSLESLIEYTMWGTQTVTQGNKNETATGRYLDVQPLINKLHVFSDAAEEVENMLAGYVIDLVDTLDKDGSIYTKTYGRRFIIESPDVLLDKYNTSKEKGAPITILDKMLEEIISSKYKNDMVMRSKMRKKSAIEPYVHYGVQTIFDIFGAEEAEKKTMFTNWWVNEANQMDDEKVLKAAFKEWFNKNKTVIINNQNTIE